MAWRSLTFEASAAALSCLSSPAMAQNRYAPIPPAASAELPAGISVRKTPVGDVYIDAKGRVLYGMDKNTLRLDTRTPHKHCVGKCQERWEPVAAPAGTPETPAAPAGFGFGRGAGGGGGGGQRTGSTVGADAAQAAVQAQGQGGNFIGTQGNSLRAATAAPAGPDWTVGEGPNGPQLIDKRTHLVFARKDDSPDSTEWDGEENFLWNALRYVPPVPKVAAPAGVSPLFVSGAYALVDKQQRVLFVRDKAPACGNACAVPFTTGFLMKGMGDWSVKRDGDQAQWLYRGKPVFVSLAVPRSADVPDGAAVVRP